MSAMRSDGWINLHQDLTESEIHLMRLREQCEVRGTEVGVSER